MCFQSIFVDRELRRNGEREKKKIDRKIIQAGANVQTGQESEADCGSMAESSRGIE